MRLWVTATNTDSDEWNQWTNKIFLWLKYVCLNEFKQYLVGSTFFAVYDYSYHYQHPIHQERNNVKAIQFLDGWANFGEQKLYNSIKINNEIVDEDPFNKSKSITGEFTYVKISSSKIIVTTDFYATKPIYYKRNKESFVAANDLRVMLLRNSIIEEVDYEKCKFFLSSSSSISENEPSSQETFFKNIKKVAPNQQVIFKQGDIKYNTYIDIDKHLIGDGAIIVKPDLEYTNKIKSVFEKAVSDRIQYKPVSLMLSGGIDSSIILSAIKSLSMLDKVMALNMSFKDPDLCIAQDQEIATKLIKDFGIKGGIVWGDKSLRIPNIDMITDPLNFVDGPNSSSNKLIEESFTYYSSLNKIDTILTGEQGDAILGEDNINLIYDSLFKAKKYNDVYNLLKFHLLPKKKNLFLKNIFTHFIFNLIPPIKNRFYHKTYWHHTTSEIPYYFLEPMIKFENSINRYLTLQSLDYKFDLVGHKYVFDYFFPRTNYMNLMNILVIYSHPFIDINILRFIFSSPTYIHCNYKNYTMGESYFRAKNIAREAYKNILPDYARLKKHKTSYAGMARKIMLNSKKDIINLIFHRKDLYISEIGLIDQHKFRMHVGAALIKMDDPNNNLGLTYQYMRTALQLEIWLNYINMPFERFIDATAPRKP